MAIQGASRQTIAIDHARKLVEVTVTGFFSPEAAHAATMETRATIETLGSAVGQHVTLYDMRETATAPAKTVELLQMGFANPIYRRLWARKVAFLTRSSLLRRQIERVRESRPDIGIYEDRELALAWLLEA